MDHEGKKCGVYRKADLPNGPSELRTKHANLRDFIYKKTGYRKDLNILVFGPTQVGKGSTIQGICQALAPADVDDTISLRVSVGPCKVSGTNKQNTPFLQPTLAENGFPITLWDCMGFDVFDEACKKHILAVLTGFQKPEEDFDLTSTTANLVADGKQFSPHVILFVISCAESEDPSPWLSTRPSMIKMLLEMAKFVKEIARKQDSKFMLVVTRRDVYEGFDKRTKDAADFTIRRFEKELDVEAASYLYNPEREVRNLEAECHSLELVKQCVIDSVGIHSAKSSISYVLTITKAWYGVWEGSWGKDVTDTIQQLVKTLFRGGFDLKKQLPDAYFVVNNTTMKGDPFYFVVKGIWIQYRIDQILSDMVMASCDMTVQKLEWDRFTAKSFENPFVTKSPST